jgi:hypothetical protein
MTNLHPESGNPYKTAGKVIADALSSAALIKRQP